MRINENILRKIIRESLMEMGVQKITPTVPMLKQWFDELNQKYFNGQLPDIRIEVEPINGSTWGHFVSQGRSFYRKNRAWVRPFNTDYVHIGISSNYDGTEYNLKNTLLHEMVHYYIHYKLNYHPTRSHGWEFTNEAYRVNNIAKRLGEPWEITATNDYVENEVSQSGLERYKNRIKSEYIIGIDEEKDKYGQTIVFFFRTEEKYINNIKAIYPRSNIKFYKLLTDNPKFALQTSICRTRISGYAAKTEKDVIEKVKGIFGNFQLIPFDEGILNNIKLSGKKYIIGVMSLWGSTFYAFKTEWKYVNEIKKAYPLREFNYYNVKEYDSNFDLIPTTKRKISAFGSSDNEKTAIVKLELKYNCKFSLE